MRISLGTSSLAASSAVKPANGLQQRHQFSLLLPSTSDLLSAMGIHWDNSPGFDERGDDERTATAVELHSVDMCRFNRLAARKLERL